MSTNAETTDRSSGIGGEEMVADVDAVRARIDLDIRERLVRPLLSAALVDEHRSNPYGPHSPSLGFVLRYLRRDAARGSSRYFIYRAGENDYRLITRSLAESGRMTFEDQVYASPEDAEHEVFVRRLGDLGLSTE